MYKTLFLAAALFATASARPCHGPQCEEETVVSSPALPTAPEGACTNGEFQCFGDHIIQCNLGTWVIWHCGSGTACVPNDYECVPADRWDAVSAQAASAVAAMSAAHAPVATRSIYSAPTPVAAPSPPEGSCVTGEFQCYGDHIIQCNHESWIIWPCASGTACVPNDYECVPHDRWSAVFSQVNPTSTDCPPA
jgi:uncharacterized low-complexity protein